MAKTFNSRKELYDAIKNAPNLRSLEYLFDLTYEYSEGVLLMTLNLPHLDLAHEKLSDKTLYILAGLSDEWSLILSHAYYLDARDSGGAIKDILSFDEDSLKNICRTIADLDYYLTDTIIEMELSTLLDIILKTEFPFSTDDWIDYYQDGYALVLYKKDLEFYPGAEKRRYFLSGSTSVRDSTVIPLVSFTPEGFVVIEGEFKGKLVKFKQSDELCFFPNYYEVVTNNKGSTRRRPFDGGFLRHTYGVKAYTLKNEGDFITTDDELVDVDYMFI